MCRFRQKVQLDSTVWLTVVLPFESKGQQGFGIKAQSSVYGRPATKNVVLFFRRKWLFAKYLHL